jgi:hypothetical protein
MGNYILVPLSPHDQVEGIIPRIEEVAQDGMTVIFLIAYQANSLIENRRIKAELLANGMLTDKKALMKYSYEKQTRLADEKTSVAGEALHQRGINVITYVYMGPLRRLLKSYKRNGGVHRVLLPRRNAISIVKFLRGTIAFFSPLKRFNSLPHLYYCREI